MNDTDTARTAQRKAFNTVMEGVAASLSMTFGGEGFEESYHPSGYLSDTNGRLLFAQTIWNKPDRISLTVSLDKELGGFYSIRGRTSITVSGDKAAGRIAGDITRRIMPNALEVRSAAQNSKRLQFARDTERLDALTLLDAASGNLGTIGPRASYGSDATPMLYLKEPGKSYDGVRGNVEVSGKDVTLHLDSLPVEVAAKVIAALRDALDADQPKDVAFRLSYYCKDFGLVLVNSFTFRPRRDDEIAAAYGDAVRDNIRNIMGYLEPDGWYSASAGIVGDLDGYFTVNAH